MNLLEKIEKISIPPRSVRLLDQLMAENPELEKLISEAGSPGKANESVYNWVHAWLDDGHKDALDYYSYKSRGREAYEALSWREVGAIRLLDYIDNAGREFENLNKKIKRSVSDPIRLVWLAYHKGKGGGKPEFFYDMIHLFRQFTG